MMFEHELLEQARADRRRVVLPEGTEERVLRAADVLLRRGVCDLTLLGDGGADPQEGRATSASTSTAPQLVDPQTSRCASASPSAYAQLRAHKGVTRRAGARRGRGRELLRHADGPGGPGRRHGLGRGALHGRDHPPRLRDHQDQAGRRDRLLGLLHVPGRQGPGLRRLRGQPGPGRRAARGHRRPVGRHRRAVRRGAADRDAVVLDRHLGLGRRRRQGARGHRAGARARGPTCWSRARSSTTRPSSPPSRRPSCRAPRWRARPPC